MALLTEIERSLVTAFPLPQWRSHDPHPTPLPPRHTRLAPAPGLACAQPPRLARDRAGVPVREVRGGVDEDECDETSLTVEMTQT